MLRIYCFGDEHTAAAFRVGGATAVEASAETIERVFTAVCERGDAGIVIITRALADSIRDTIKDINLNSFVPVIVEIPGLAEGGAYEGSVLDYLTEALGVSL